MLTMNRRTTIRHGLAACAALLAVTTAATPAFAASSREEARLIEASGVLEELRASRDQYIPDRLLERAYGIAVIPGVVKGGLGIGGRFGRGVLVVRDKDGRFTNPAFVNLTGGSFGWQIGVQSIDVVLVFTTRAGIEGITDGQLTLGADASVAAGPIGRQASAGTDPSFSKEVYSYSRTRGLFAGLALDGSAITIDRKANARFYKQRVTASDIFTARVTTDSDTTKRFLRAVQTSTTSVPGTHQAAKDSAAATPAPATDAAPAASATDATTFPMEDSQPGQEPPKQ
jgi:lipid-binding SYLF domain-containing protein